jgi:hypothetical protein
MTPESPRRRYSLAARLLFVSLDRLYGRERTLDKLRAFEIVARVPARLLILNELVERERAPARWRRKFWFDLLPRVIAAGYWHVAARKPRWSQRLTADFQDRAEREYAFLVAEHPEWEQIPYFSVVADHYATFDCLADLFRQLCHDEWLHTHNCLQRA